MSLWTMWFATCGGRWRPCPLCDCAHDRVRLASNADDQNHECRTRPLLGGGGAQTECQIKCGDLFENEAAGEVRGGARRHFGEGKQRAAGLGDAFREPSARAGDVVAPLGISAPHRRACGARWTDTTQPPPALGRPGGGSSTRAPSRRRSACRSARTTSRTRSRLASRSSSRSTRRSSTAAGARGGPLARAARLQRKGGAVRPRRLPLSSRAAVHRQRSLVGVCAKTILPWLNLPPISRFPRFPPPRVWGVVVRAWRPTDPTSRWGRPTDRHRPNLSLDGRGGCVDDYQCTDPTDWAGLAGLNLA